jgi:hypothetical protein
MFSTTLIVTGLVLGQAELPKWARNSTWETAYESAAGIMYATVHIKETTGVYRLPGGVQGTLSGIRFVQNMKHQLGDVSDAIVGNWRFPTGEIGYFVFRKPDQAWYTDGYWGFIRGNRWDQIAGSWDGCLVLKAPSAPQQEVAPLEIVPLVPQKNLDPPRQNNLIRLPVEPEAGFAPGGNAKARQLIKAGNHCRAVGQIKLSKSTKVFVPNAAGQLATIEGVKGQRAGTCFLIAPNLALSAKHIFERIPDWEAVEIEFATGLDQPPHITALSRRPIFGQYDSCLLVLKTPVPPTHPVIDITEAMIPGRMRRLSHFEYTKAHIIHFPSTSDGQEWNEFKGKFVDRNDRTKTLIHDLPTHGGSSGAPLFDYQWRVVAVHFGAQDKNLNTGYLIDAVIDSINAEATDIPEWQSYQVKIVR